MIALLPQMRGLRLKTGKIKIDMALRESRLNEVMTHA
jgi:hypothetical protein